MNIKNDELVVDGVVYVPKSKLTHVGEDLRIAKNALEKIKSNDVPKKIELPNGGEIYDNQLVAHNALMMIS